ncbi:MAG: hypothetical protein V4710_18100, partial [Verrucomicrobiota bacterium]
MKIPSLFPASLFLAGTLFLSWEARAARPAPGVIQELIPAGKYARRIHRPLRPTYITIHSTENYQSGAVIHG